MLIISVLRSVAVANTFGRFYSQESGSPSRGEFARCDGSLQYRAEKKEARRSCSCGCVESPPDTNSASSVANDLKFDTLALLYAKKMNIKLQKSKAENGGTRDGASGSVPENILDSNPIPEEANVLDVVLVQKSKKKRKTAASSEVGLAHVTLNVEDVGKTLDSAEGAGISEENGFGGGSY